MSEKRNGSAHFTDYDGYLAWYSSLETLDAMDAAHNQMRKATVYLGGPGRLPGRKPTRRPLPAFSSSISSLMSMDSR